ncbi:hypothetical protein C6P40_003575 [Pichia californica]|uniref:Uncharacterized protein n=1 Tax=Pichia californica TaxID=460514 RepID=A0A9P6WH75_9ASCO|nr:hypothetical protein C6P42_003302 [[Candida] californica]KAG0686684.1 hypothetical protein C6P40_003575 [[Candida] californica]
MSKWFSKSIDCTIKLRDPPNHNKYSPRDHSIKASISIKFLEQQDKICFIRCGLAASAYVEMQISRMNYDAFYGTGVRYEMVKDDHYFFNSWKDFTLNENAQKNYDDNSPQYHEIDTNDAFINDDLININDNNDNNNNNNNINNSMKTYSFTPGEKIKENFEFELPNGIYLPSSCKRFGDINGDLTVTYQLYVNVYKIGGLFNKKPKISNTFKIPIIYQSGKDPNFEKFDKILIYGIQEIFNDKVKKFYYDKETNALIPTSIKTNHVKTKFIRQLWNDDYKDKNYINITKSIPIKLKFSIDSSIDLYVPLSNQLSISLISDLKSVGINSNQSTDFVLNGQSTNLGVFKLESLTIEAHYKTYIKCRQYSLKINESEPILKIKFKNLVYDIKDFKYSKLDGIYKKDITISELIKASIDIDITKSLMEILGDTTLITTGNIADWFDNSLNFRFCWKVSDGGSQIKKFEFITSSTADFLIGIVNSGSSNVLDDRDRELFTPPPTYEKSKDDEKLCS